MPVYQTVLIYVCIPLGIVLLLAALVYGPSATRRFRYRTGEPWPFEPVWFCPHPQALDRPTQHLLALPARQLPAIEATQRAAITGGGATPEPGTGTAEPVSAAPAATAVRAGARLGGAHGDW